MRGWCSCLLCPLMLIGFVMGCADDPSPVHDSPPYAFVSPDLTEVDPEVADLLGDMIEAAEQDASGDTWGVLAMALDVNGFADAAHQGYEIAQHLSPADPRWPYYQALLTAHRGDLVTALQQLRRSIDIEPDYGPAWLWRGSWQQDLGMDEPAITSFRRAAQLGVGDVATLAEAGALLAQGRAESALDLLAALREDGRVVRYRLRALRQLGRREEATSLLAGFKHPEPGPLSWPDERTRAKQVYEVSNGARLSQARRLLDGGDPDAALALLKSLAKKNPDHQGLLSAEIEALRQLGRRSDMAARLDRAVGLYPEYYGFHLSLAEYALEKGDRASAAQHLMSTIRLNDQIPWAHAQMGLFFVEENRLPQASAAFRAALDLEPDNPQINYYMGMIHANQQNWAEAIRRFDAAVANAPELTVAWIALARSLWSSGDRDRARHALNHAEQLGTHPNETQAVRVSMETQASTR